MLAGEAGLLFVGYYREMKRVYQLVWSRHLLVVYTASLGTTKWVQGLPKCPALRAAGYGKVQQRYRSIEAVFRESFEHLEHEERGITRLSADFHRPLAKFPGVVTVRPQMGAAAFFILYMALLAQEAWGHLWGLGLKASPASHQCELARRIGAQAKS